ncbi:protein WHAT'S THIS FACTOR 1 homolog, chloroplastic-like [Eucalyptus grandis]|uniref:protein WHAT'S THIS FACTOR 1 homolog, chloroplastic-like n=1 Tax=Eucalyptus grandis TaxID=71139 RepID=UPI00192EB51A|nr:protein WHAT'S THIS FACTOR 1 homolog, chloroplastic-like [Eucalyptus grandis]
MTRLRIIGKTVASSNEWGAAREFGCFVASPVRLPTLRRNWSFGEVLLSWPQHRFMTTSKRVQDRSKDKRVHYLEIATEKHKVVSKVLVLMEMLKKEPEMIIPVRSLDRCRNQINLPRPHSIVDFIQKSPKLFELCKDRKGVLWCGMTKEAEDLLEEEEKLIREHSGKAAEYVTRMLMMSADKRLPLDKIAHFRREFGLSADFRSKWVHEYPQHFQVVKSLDEVDYLELVEWNPAWAITELEKAVLGVSESASHAPGLLSLSFPLKFPATYKKVYRYGGKIEHFQKRSYLSPYADARGLQPGLKEFDKRAIAVMHELLSFTMEKRLVTDHLTHFRREFVMPQKLMRLFLKHFGIFYVSERGKRFSVFLTGAYEGAELIQKCPLVIKKEKVLSLIGYRGKKKRIETFTDLSDVEDNEFLGGSSEDGGTPMQLDQIEAISELEDVAVGDSSFMDIHEIDNEYKPHNSF